MYSDKELADMACEGCGYIDCDGDCEASTIIHLQRKVDRLSKELAEANKKLKRMASKNKIGWGNG